jgi:hypothetical protein
VHNKLTGLVEEVFIPYRAVLVVRFDTKHAGDCYGAENLRGHFYLSLTGTDTFSSTHQHHESFGLTDRHSHTFVRSSTPRLG